MNLAKAIGANPNKFMGTRTNITFLGKGPTKNPLFQSPIAGLEGASEAQLGSKESIIGAVEDAMGFASAQKLNSIQTQALGINLENILKTYRPPPLPSASVTAIRPGIEGLRRFPKESHRFFGRPLKDKDFTEIDRLFQGPITSTGPKGTRTWNFTRTPEAGPGAFTKALNQKTGMSRAIARQILQQDTRLKLKPEELFMLREGKGEPLDLMKKYYGRSVLNLDEWLDRAAYANFTSAKEAAAAALKEIELIPQFAEGGLAEILQAPRSGYSKGRLVKGALAILNRNKKNADYMFKASDNVSPGYARGDIKYNAELLADQLAEDAGVIYDDLGHLERTKFYGTAYDYLAAEMGKHLLQKRMLKDIGQKMVLSDFSIKGRKPNASGGLARILEI